MKIAVSIGHTLEGIGSGAVGILNESICNREIGDALVSYLQQLGHEVILCRVDSSPQKGYDYSTRVKISNNANVDLFVELHLNSGGGVGSEVLIFKTGGVAETYARQVLDKIVALGYKDRGIKVRQDLYVLKNTNCPAILVENCFVDSQEDANRYNAKDLAKAIAEGITGQTIEENQPQQIEDNFDAIGYMIKYRDLVEAYANSHPDFIEWAKWHYSSYGREEIEQGRR